MEKVCKGCGKRFTPIAAFPEAEICKTGCGNINSGDPYYFKFMVDIDPMGKPRMTKADAWKGRDVVNRYWKFKDDLVKAAKEQRFLLNNAYHVVFYIAMPASWSKKKKAEMKFTHHEAKPDIDNLIKSVNDCLLPESDSAVHSVLAHKVWAERGMIIITNYPELPLSIYGNTL